MVFAMNSPQLCPSPNEIIADILSLDGDESGSSLRNFGSFSGAIYDTAWLSMITKKEQGQTKVLFPECFEFLLAAQHKNGTWGPSSTQIDVITNSLAALLALATRQRSNLPQPSDPNFLHTRIKRGKVAVQAVLQTWNVKDSVHVGFEVLVPSLLSQLSAWDIKFEFPGYATLMQLSKKKLQKFKPAILYSPKSTTLLHSLEALVGLIDFDRVSHHCNKDTGIFGSPSATAAYLIYGTTWDQRAELYLRTVISSTGQTGYVPSAYPTCLFELSWALSTLLSPRVTSHALSVREKNLFASFFEDTLEAQSGTVGFVPGVLEDADDTARSLMALRCLGKSPSTCGLIEKFQTADHFRTYHLEGSSSFSANCNVLLALLGDSEGGLHQENIKKALSFLLELEETGPIHDKWNISSQYSKMLFMQAIVLILEKHNASQLENLASTGFVERLLGAACRLLSQTLSEQQPNGSWSHSLEITSYSVITVGYALSLPWGTSLKDRLRDSVQRGQNYVHTNYNNLDRTDFLWVEKVSYKSLLLHSVYCSAALHLHVVEVPWTSSIVDAFTLQKGSLKKTQYLISSLPLFQNVNFPFLELDLIQAQLLAAKLKSVRNSLYSRSEIPMTGDKYLEFIPMIWVMCNRKNSLALSYKIMWEMVYLSLLNFQVDEYMETMVARLPHTAITSLMGLLEYQTHSASTTGSSSSSSSGSSSSSNHANGSSPTTSDRFGDLLLGTQAQEAFKTLNWFIQHVKQHRVLIQSPTYIQREMALELYRFIQAHNKHNNDNALLAIQKAGRGVADTTTSQGQSYIQWVRGTASDDTSCPFSFLFFACLISEPQTHCFAGTRAHYFSQSLCRHLATMCRQYNDFGSATRDAEEQNLNSLDFPVFHEQKQDLGDNVNGMDASSNGTEGASYEVSDSEPPTKKQRRDSPLKDGGAGDRITSAKESLMALAEFERAGMELAKEELSFVVPRRCMEQLQVFIDVTDMFGQVYVQKDIASRRIGP